MLNKGKFIKFSICRHIVIEVRGPQRPAAACFRQKQFYNRLPYLQAICELEHKLHLQLHACVQRTYTVHRFFKKLQIIRIDIWPLVTKHNLPLFSLDREVTDVFNDAFNHFRTIGYMHDF